MTDQTGMFGDDAYDGESEGGRDKKTLLVAGGLAALVLGAGAFFLLGSGGGDASADLTAGTQPNANAQLRAAKAKAGAGKAAAPTSAQPTKAPVVPDDATLDIGRNPFVALYVEPVASVAKDAGTTTTTTTTTAPVTPTTTTPTTGGTTVSPTVAPPTMPTRPTTPAVVLHKLVLQSVSEGADPTKTVGTFQIAGKKYVVPVGQVFGPTNELIVVAFQQDAQGVWTAVLRVGDGAPFDAVQGDELNVM